MDENRNALLPRHDAGLECHMLDSTLTCTPSYSLKPVTSISSTPQNSFIYTGQHTEPSWRTVTDSEVRHRMNA